MSGWQLMKIIKGFSLYHWKQKVEAVTFRKIIFMDTTTFPAVVVPHIHVDADEMLMDPINIHLGEDIRNPDLIIDNLIEYLKEKGMDTTWLFTIREFTHKEKAKWIFSLPDPTLMLIAEENFIFPVSVHSTVMVKVAETLGGESLYEKKDVERIIEKCVPIKS